MGVCVWGGKTGTGGPVILCVTSEYLPAGASIQGSSYQQAPFAFVLFFKTRFLCGDLAVRGTESID